MRCSPLYSITITLVVNNKSGYTFTLTMILSTITLVLCLLFSPLSASPFSPKEYSEREGRLGSRLESKDDEIRALAEQHRNELRAKEAGKKKQ